MNYTTALQQALEPLIAQELERIAGMQKATQPLDFSAEAKIVIGILPGDGIGPIIMRQALRVLEALLADELAAGKIELRHIEGMTIENRAAQNNSLPEEVFAEIERCHVILKGPMVTPRPGDPWPNLPSANALLRRRLDLFAAVRPVKMPEKGIDWTFFRENIEGEYLWGNKGVQLNDDLAVDFRVQTRPGSERIARLAFDYARKNGKKNVTVVTKANIVKLTDGNFIEAVRRVGQDYPDIAIAERLIDVTAAKMMDPEFNEGLEVFVLPNLYGDIITDIAAEHQGGLGTASSSNLGTRYAMFEAIHGTAPFLMQNGRGDYADPASLIRAAGMLLAHIGHGDKRRRLEAALDTCTRTERRQVVTTFKEGASAEQFTTYLLETLQSQNPAL
ncbi:isocitrate/isopropylmalate dehydrogenase family protein [Ruminococcaceae bacterium OttesenSCG-928-A11]|nr:isocitrate/isopropylmalate dehydrogenase family protein [Ruminococcaceae bacterium OttesenSCG-928-A11]